MPASTGAAAIIAMSLRMSSSTFEMAITASSETSPERMAHATEAPIGDVRDREQHTEPGVGMTARNDGSRAGVEPIPSRVMRHEERPVPRTELPLAGAVTHVVKVRVADVDAQCEHARSHGARVLQEPTEYEHGEGVRGSGDRCVYPALMSADVQVSRARRVVSWRRWWS